MRGLLFASCIVVTGFSTAFGATFSVFLDGSQEVGVGDPTGFGSGTITLDPVLDTISWNVNYFNLTDNPFYPVHPSGWHIHGPGGPPGTNAPILVNLNQLVGLGLPNGTLSGSTSAPSATIDAILANTSDFYVNLHTADESGGLLGGFPAGAIRGQIPEPSSLALLALGGLALLGMLWRQYARKG